MSLGPVNSVFFVSLVSDTFLFPGFVNLPLGLKSLKHARLWTLIRQFYQQVSF